MNYYPFHIGDYLSATRHLSWEEDAAYRRLLDTYYTTEKPLPADLRAVCRLVLATTDSQREAVKVVLEEFFQATPEGWRNSRADAEIAEMQIKQQKQRDKANAMWEKRRASTGTSTSPERGIAPALPQHQSKDAAASEVDANAMPPTPTPTPTPKSISSEPFRASEPVSSFAIPLVDGTDYQVTVRELDEWSRAYPAVDVPKELRQMRVWCMANSTKRKTRRGAPAFAVKWLSKAQDTPSHHRRDLAGPPAGDWTGSAL